MEKSYRTYIHLIWMYEYLGIQVFMQPKMRICDSSKVLMQCSAYFSEMTTWLMESPQLKAFLHRQRPNPRHTS